MGNNKQDINIAPNSLADKSLLDEVDVLEIIFNKTLHAIKFNDECIIEEIEEKLINKQLKKTTFRKKIFAGIAIALLGFIITSTVSYGLIINDKSAKEAIRTENMLKSEKDVNLGDNLRKNVIKTVKKEEYIPAYSLKEIYKMDMRKPSGVTAADLKLITRQNLVGLEDAFVKAEKKYGINALFLIGIASMESANGSICFKPNNMFGYGSKGYSSKEACIYDVAQGLSNNYLKPGASLYNGTRISDVNKRYASSSTWDQKVANNMHRYYSVINTRRKSAIKKLTK